MKFVVKGCLGLLLMVSLTFAATGDSKADKWISKLIDSYGDAPFSADMTIEMDMEVGGQAITGKIDGVHYFKDAKTQRMEMKMDMVVPQQGPMKIEMLLVMDGAMLWMKMNNPAMGGDMYMKASFETLAKAGQGGPMGNIGDLTKMSPVETFKKMKDMMDFTVAEESGGKVVLSAELTDEAANIVNMGGMPMGEMLKGGKIHITMDAKKVFPIQSQVHLNGKPAVTTTYGNVKKLGEAEIKEGALFSYTPPENAFVIDLGQMMNQQQQQ